MVEVAKNWSAKLYPDLEQAGGLPDALQAMLTKLPGELKVEGLGAAGLVYASVRRESRSSQVMIAASHRAFHADFWDRGVQYGSGWAKSLEDVAVAIHAFVVMRVDADTLKGTYRWVNVSEHALLHERGPEAFVERAWQDHLAWLSREPPKSREGALLPLVAACMSRPRLRRLMPYTSMDRLCFSRTTGYPYTCECPRAFPLGDGRFAMSTSDTGLPPIEGDAEAIAARLEAELAPDCPAAIHGTADDERYRAT